MINVFLVDDHDILLDGIAAILKESASELVTVVGRANTAEMAEQYIKANKPDVVITDISMPGRSGAELTTLLKKKYPELKIIALSMHSEANYITAMLNAGASGYLLKTVKNNELITAICAVHKGEMYIQQSLARGFTTHQHHSNTSEKAKMLSPREIEIIKLIAQDMTTADISKKLYLSVYTVETHRKNIWRKTGVKSLMGLINYAKANEIL
ncbi:MAG TPA: response regulator transcription factor [Mucilaginibacter sp.]|jgi:DNA-binding NarL/FixJ family response regulator|nr:response regulator transcription factor [Mucilaginibacter sp.]